MKEESPYLASKTQGLLSTGSTQGIGFGVLRGLASAGADVVMHGLIGPKEFEEKVGSMQEEFGVQVGQSSADVRNPEDIRSAPKTNHRQTSNSARPATAQAKNINCIQSHIFKSVHTFSSTCHTLISSCLESARTFNLQRSFLFQQASLRPPSLALTVVVEGLPVIS